MIEVVRITAADTHDLRRRVLRAGTPSDVVAFDGDDLPDTVHLGALVDGTLVGISTWLRRRYPDRPALDGVQLRGMATDPDHRGIGVAGALLRHGVAWAEAVGAELVWARARDRALDFYRSHGFVVVGAGYTDLTTAIPHHDIVRELTPG